MRPTTAVHRQDLGMTTAEFDLQQSRNTFIGQKVMPIVGRDLPSGEYPRIPLESLLQDHETEHADGAEYDFSDADWGQDSYVTEEHGHEVTLTDRTVKKYGNEIDAEFYQTQRAIDIVLRRYERDVANLVMATSTYPDPGQIKDLVAAKWDQPNWATADVVAELEPAREAFVLRFGTEPNALVMNRPMMRNMINHEKIIGRLKYQGFQDARAGMINASQLAVSLDIDQIIVAGGIHNTANVAKSRNIARIWPTDKVLLCRVAETDDPGEPCIGRTLIWQQESAMDGDMLDVIVEEYRAEKRRGTTYRARNDRGIKLMYAEAAHLFYNAA